jgi:hypothetical protein
MLGIIDAVDQGVGKAREHEPESVERQIEELGKVSPV